MKQVPSVLYLIFALPLVFIVAGVLLIATAPRNDPNIEIVGTESPVPTLSEQVAAIATINAAPVRPLRAPAASGSSEGFASLGVDPARVASGQIDFASLCASCHGADARGMVNLGKDLVGTEFVRGISNDELADFVKIGRPIWDAANTTGVDMPPKGGNPALSEESIVNIILYLRSLDADYVPSESDLAAVAGEEAPEPVAAQPEVASASDGPDEPASNEAVVDSASDGEALFVAACAACHGPDARGLPNLGHDLVVSEFVSGTSDDDLLNFVKTGRPLWDPANTTGIDMPSKGGNPALTDEDILSIITYLRSRASASDEPGEPASNEAVVDSAPDGEALFIAACSACHGPDARGLPNLGHDLVASEFVSGTSDDDLLTFVKTGRPLWDPANTSGIDMPPKGGNPALSDEGILSIIAHLRSIEE